VITRRAEKKHRSERTAEARAARLEARAKKQKGLCWFCNEPMGYDCTREHLQPRARGGTDEAANIRAAHGDCNSAAGHLAVKKKYELRRIGHTAGRLAVLEAAHRMRRHQSYIAFNRALGGHQDPGEAAVTARARPSNMRQKFQAKQAEEEAEIKRQARKHYWAKLGLLGKPDWWDG
jgi:hypothetical protein